MMRSGIAGLALALSALGAQPAAAQFYLQGEIPLGPCTVVADKHAPADPPPACAKAIAAAATDKDKAILYFYWAYSLNDVGNTAAALPNLDAAIRLAPDFINAYYERSYTHGMLCEFDLGLADADRAVKLRPGNAQMLLQRAFGKSFVGDYAGELADCDAAIAASRTTPALQVCRAEALLGLGRDGDAQAALAGVPDSASAGAAGIIRADAARMIAYRPDGKGAARCKMEGMGDRNTADRFLADCTWALRNQPDRAKRADLLMVRGLARRIAQQDDNAGLPDFALAAVYAPSDPGPRSNYGFALLVAGRTVAAKRQFDAALALPNLKPSVKAFTLAGRAQASYDLGDSKAAFADAKASYELEPTPPALDVLGQMAFDRGDKASAKLFWMGEWHLGVRDDRLRARLETVGVADPDREPRK